MEDGLSPASDLQSSELKHVDYNQRFLDKSLAGTHFDKKGYKVEVIPKKPNTKLSSHDKDDAHYNGDARQGEIFITHPNGERVSNGFWMDHWEPSHGVSKKHYGNLPTRNRAELEAKLQNSYEPLDKQFERRKVTWGSSI